MEKIKQYKFIILIVIIILGIAFYWFEWRPAQIRKECSERSKVAIYGSNYNNLFNQCLHEKGL